MICEICGIDYQVGQWFKCPHGWVSGREDRTTYVADDIPGGLELENVGPEPVRVYSYTEMEQLYASRGLRRAERFSPTPGTDHDPAGVANPKSYMDRQTLENGKELILRGARDRQAAAEAAAYTDRLFVNRESRTLSEEESAQAHRDIAAQEEWRGKGTRH